MTETILKKFLFFGFGGGWGWGGGGGGNALHETTGCHCSCSTWKAMSPLLEPRCTTLMWFIDKAMDTIVASWFFKTLN